MNRVCVFLSALLFAGLFLYGCPQKNVEPEGPPQSLVDTMDAARSTYDQVSKRAPDREELEDYKNHMDQARQAMDARNYSRAQEKARKARLVVERLHARLVYEELKERYDPSSSLTYHVRKQMALSRSEEKKGNIEAAIKASLKAREQAELAIGYEKQCLEKASKRLADLKEKVEKLYRPPLGAIELYWKAEHEIDKKSCTEAKKAMDLLEDIVWREKETMVYSHRRYEVHASEDYLKRYGKPAMFESVTPQGLVKVINRVAPGKEVIFVRSLLYSPSRTYYRVKDPETGVTGWMAEKRIWPDRAAKMKELGARYGS